MEDVTDLLPNELKTPIRMVDGGFHRVQRWLLDTVGPLSKLWSLLEVAKKGSGKCDLKKNDATCGASCYYGVADKCADNHNRGLN